MSKLNAELYTDCPNCQARLKTFHAVNPSVDVESEVMNLLCRSCEADYQDWAESCECPHGVAGWENCEVCSEEWIAANEPEDVCIDHPSDWEVQHGIA